MTSKQKYEVTGLVVHYNDSVSYNIKEYTYATSKSQAMNNIGHRLKGRVVGNAVMIPEEDKKVINGQLSLFDTPPAREGAGGGLSVQSQCR